MSKNVYLLFGLIFLSAFSVVHSQTTDSTHIPAVIKSVTKHSATIAGKLVNYTVIAGTIITKKDDEPVAMFGYTAYIKDGETDLTKRPITFAYNGGPGTSSMWLHIGILGPRKVVVNDVETTPAPTYKIEDNDNSILDVTDIVFIDPVGTGISKAIGKAKNKDFWGVAQDIISVSNFIKQYITENDRWNTPRFLLGESYGTLRSAGVVDYLQKVLSLSMNGVILVSNILDYRMADDKSDLNYALRLPSFAAAAWYYNKVANKPASLEVYLKEVKKYAADEYTVALMKGDQLSDTEKLNVAIKLSVYIGLSKEYILDANLRVSSSQFRQQLLRDEHMTIGRLDTRFKGINQDRLSEDASYDPQGSAISPAFVSMFMDYYYRDLKMDKSLSYQISSEEASRDWDWTHYGDVPATADDLAHAMSHNPQLKVLVLNGYYDLADTFFSGSEYVFDHMGLEKKIKQNITNKYYEAGHMMYVNAASAKQFKKDVAEFIVNAGK